jgi:tripartite-type tricarboxylate transporter receptor subunit TctC
MRRHAFRFLPILAALLFALANTAFSQTWPARPIKLIVAQGPGSAPDVVARFIGDRLTRGLGQQVLVDNRAGGDGLIGMQAAARAQPDGYTLVFAVSSSIVLNPVVFKTLPYHAEKDFVSIGMVGISPLIVVVNAEVKANTLGELIALAKAEPGKLAFASPGRRRLPGMIGDMIKIKAGIDMLHVPYQGAQGIQDTLAGRTQITVQGIPAVASMLQRGQLRALAVSSGRRLPGLELVPSIAETLPGFDYVGWFALMAPAGTPAEPIQRVNRELGVILGDAEVRDRLRALGIYADGAGTPAELDAFIKGEAANWARTVKELGIEPE